MLPIILALGVLGVSFILAQSQSKTRESDRRDLAPVRVRAARPTVERRRVR